MLPFFNGVLWILSLAVKASLPREMNVFFNYCNFFIKPSGAYFLSTLIEGA